MRILTVGNQFPPHDGGGGYELTWASWVAYMRQRGDDVRVLTTDFRAPGVSEVEEPDVRRELRWYWRDHGFPRLSRRKRRELESWNAEVLAGEVVAFAPDAIAWWAMGGMSLDLIPQAAEIGVRAVGVVGDRWMEYGPELTRVKARNVDLSAPLWLFNSEHTRQASLAAGFDLPRTRVAHPGVDHDLFRPHPARERWAWRLLYVGRLDERKGVHVAAEALAHLPAKTVLVVQGAGDPAYVRALERHRGVQSSAVPRSSLPDVYATADAVVFPVRWHEPWGLVPLEAMAVGRPVVATGTGGSAEYLRDGENCLIYEPAESPEALAAALRSLASDRSLRDRLREGGFATAARFSARSYNEAIAAALDEVAAA